MCSVNITSLYLHFETLLAHYDIVLVQESRLTEFGQVRLRFLLMDHQWSAIWGPPRPPQRDLDQRDSFSGKCGGVAILYRNYLHLQLAPHELLADYPALQTHRFVHGILSSDSGPSIHLLSIYGFTGADVHDEAKANNDALFTAVFDYVAQFGNSPIYLGMDANTDTLSSQSLSTAYLSQRWYDLGLVYANTHDEIPQPTCFAKGNPHGRRIDYVYVNAPALNAVISFRVEEDIPIPTHRPLVFLIDYELFSSTITRLALPPTCYDIPHPSAYFLQAFHSLFVWDITRFGGDVDAAYNCWTEWAQQYLTTLTNHDFHSRGNQPCFKTGTVAPPKSKEFKSSSRPLVTLSNLVTQTLAFMHQSLNAQSSARFRSQLRKIRYLAQQVLPNQPDTASLEDYLIQIQYITRQQLLSEQSDFYKQRRNAWRAWTEDTWKLNSKKIYQLVKGKSVEPFTYLLHNGNVVTDRQQIDVLLQEAWKPIFVKYPTSESKGSSYRQTFYPLSSPFSTFLLPELTLDDLHYVFKKKLRTHTATGPDGWRAHEFKALPDCLLQALLDIFHLAEQQGKFPASFYHSYTTLIPKGTSRSPLSLRPITVLPIPYRIYASLRCQSLLLWQSQWIHPTQYAFCKGRSTTSMNSHLSFDLLERFSRTKSFAGIQFDFAKCFDSIPYTVIWDVLIYHGCDPRLVALLRDLYHHIQRRFRYAGCVGAPWQATNGLLQGDPLSVVVLNCVLCPLLRRLQEIPDLSSYAFADDLTIVSSTWGSLLAAYEILMTFCSTTDLVLNLDKCQIWTKGAPSGQYPPAFNRFAVLFYPFLLGSPIDIGSFVRRLSFPF